MPISFMRWQEKSVSFEELASVPAPNTFINRQRDRTKIMGWLTAEANEFFKLHRALQYASILKTGPHKLQPHR